MVTLWFSIRQVNCTVSFKFKIGLSCPKLLLAPNGNAKYRQIINQNIGKKVNQYSLVI